MFYTSVEKKRRKNDETSKIDKRLIHDILPQFGGGNEPLREPTRINTCVFDSVKSDMTGEA